MKKEFIESTDKDNSSKFSEERYKAIIDNIEDGYYEVDLAGSFTFFNQSLCHILGYEKSEMMGMNNRRYMDKDNARRVFQSFNNSTFAHV